MKVPALDRVVEPPSVGRRPLAGLLLLLGAAFTYAYADVFRTLWFQWNVNEANSHGVLIPLIVGYLLWLERGRIASVAARPALWAGLPLLLASLAVLLIGRLAGIVGVQEVSMVGALWGIVLMMAGWPALRGVWFPIAYLLFMMPVWDLATEPMYRPLQLFAARGTETLLSAFGIPVFREGTLLLLPNTTVEVAFACSGINFLMSVLAVGVVLAYLLTRSLTRRLLILGTAVAVALLSNPMRVAFITYSFYSGLASPRQSHMWQGMAVSLGAFALVFFLAWRIAGRPAVAPIAARPISPGDVAWRPALVPALAACALLLGAGLARPLDWPTPSLEPLGLESVPHEVGEWRALRGYRPALPERGVVLTDELWREYRHPDGRAVRVYVGRFVHAFAGRGLRYWSDEFDRVTEYRDEAARDAVPVSLAAVGRGRAARPVAFWYQLGSRSTVSRALAKLYAAWGAVRGGPGAVAVVVFPGEAVDLQVAGNDLGQFALEFGRALRAGR